MSVMIEAHGEAEGCRNLAGHGDVACLGFSGPEPQVSQIACCVIDGAKKKIQLRLPLANVSLGQIAGDVDESEADSDDASKPEPFKLGPRPPPLRRARLRLSPPFPPSTP